MDLIGNKLSKIRKTKGFTQEELAERAKVNLRTIQRIENSENQPRGKTLDLICEVLEIDIKEIMPSTSSISESAIGTRTVNGLFLLILNLMLMTIIGFLTIDSNANLNSILAGFLLSVFLPFFIIVWTDKMNGIERLLKFGLGYIIYFFLVMIIHGFQIGFKTGLFPCLLISLSILYFGNELNRRIKVK